MTGTPECTVGIVISTRSVNKVRQMSTAQPEIIGPLK